MPRIAIKNFQSHDINEFDSKSLSHAEIFSGSKVMEGLILKGFVDCE
jgi:hypothetical protein